MFLLAQSFFFQYNTNSLLFSMFHRLSPRFSRVHVCMSTLYTYTRTRAHKCARARTHTHENRTRRKFGQLQPHDLSRKTSSEVDRHWTRESKNEGGKNETFFFLEFYSTSNSVINDEICFQIFWKHSAVYRS